MVLCLLLVIGVDPSDQRLFVDQVAPILERRCLSCHRGDAAKGGLSLETLARLKAGGESGSVISFDNVAESLLLAQVSGEKPAMPQNAPPLSAAEIALLKTWIERGMPWPNGVTLKDRRHEHELWWSLQPLKKHPIPTSNSSKPPHPIDAFIQAKQTPLGLSLSPEADRRTLIRRLSFDLLGLPPSPQEIHAFLGDNATDAYERLVDRLLASPHYGERWCRHWLDVAHYGDTHGFDKDKRRELAWPYRDYVVSSFNSDKPYGAFVQEQLAGDVLLKGSPEGIVATGFIVCGPWDFVGQVELAEGTVDKLITRNLDRDDMVAQAFSTFCSLTVHCARCHDHPFDPISQGEYYSCQAIFAGVERANVSRDPVERRHERDRLTKRLERLESQRATTKADVKAIDLEVIALKAQLSLLPKPLEVYAVKSIPPRDVRLLVRGDVRNPRELVPPAPLSLLRNVPSSFPTSVMSREGERRGALAEWIAHPGNPLTWRSIVNRVWHYHFGRGIVESTNDFGHMGSLPTHPELLDWLALDFLEHGQSMKHLHRVIVTSRAYRQSSSSDDRKNSIDSSNRLWWRMNRRRLDAESIRDAVLAVSGKLDRTLGGPGFDLFAFQDDHSPRYLYEQHNVDDPRSFRRSLYRFIVRSAPDPFFECLDGADPSLAVPVRDETLTPLQSLALLNDPFLLRQAQYLARRADAQDPRESIDRIYQFTLGRSATPSEIADATAYVARHGLDRFCRLMWNANEFLFVD